VYFDATPIGDAGLKSLAELKALEFVSIKDAKLVTDAGLDHLRSAPALRRLTLEQTTVTAAGLKRFRATNPTCSINTDVK
jgi:phosphoribosyl 1,2-cyclic phosphodiesterase